MTQTSKMITQMKIPSINNLLYRYNLMSLKASHFLKHLCTETLGNLRRFYELLKNHALSNAITLALVKLMDYSDHLPAKLSPQPLLVTCSNNKLKNHTSKHFQKLEDLSAQPINWTFDTKTNLEISYNASLGEAEVHPHIVHVFLRIHEDKRFLHFRYFDDESTVWQNNPCRASTVTLAELVIEINRRELHTLKYFRYRNPKRIMFNRRKTLDELHRLLNSSAPFLGLNTQHITFGVELSASNLQVICRYAPKPISTPRSLITSNLIDAQLSIVTAILKENVTFTKLALSSDTDQQASLNSGRVLKIPHGKKQLRIRLLR